MTNVTEFKQVVVHEIEGTIFFRKERAELYPEDDRNIQCAESLTTLAENLDKLPDDDLVLRRAEKGYREKWESTSCGLPPYDAFFFPDEENDAGGPTKTLFSQYGFHGREEGNAHEFLTALTEEIDQWDPQEMTILSE